MGYIKQGKLYYNKRKIPGTLFVLLIVMLETCFMSLPGISSIFFTFNNYHNKRLILLISLVLLLLTSKIKMRKSDIDYIVVYFTMAWLLIAMFSAVSVSSFGVILNQYYFYGIILLYFPLGKLFDSTDDMYESFLRIISITGVIYAAYFIFAKVMYDTSGVIVFNQLVQNLQRRSGLRLARPCDFLCFSFITTLCLMVKKPKNILYLRLLIIGICIYWVGQTRLYELLVVILFLIYLLVYTKVSSKIIALIVALSLWDSIRSFYEAFIGSFSAKDTLSSTLARTQGYEIVKYNIFKHYIWGSGFDGAFQFSQGGWNYALSDLGIIGYFSVWGILGIVFVIIVIVRLLLNIKFIVHDDLKYSCPETLFLSAWFVISCISVSFSDVQRIVYLPFMLLMIRQNLLIWKGESR